MIHWYKVTTTAIAASFCFGIKEDDIGFHWDTEYLIAFFDDGVGRMFFNDPYFTDNAIIYHVLNHEGHTSLILYALGLTDIGPYHNR